MQPNYTKYSIQELEDALDSLDRSTYPKRAEEIRKELQSRHVEKTEKLQSQVNVCNEEFYRCPSCKERISFFSKTLNKWSKIRICPHCKEPFKFQFSGRPLAILFIPALFVHFFLFKPLLLAIGLTGGVSAGIIGGLTAVLSMRLKIVKSNNGN